MQQYILIINGPICAGKSTVVEMLMSRHPKLFRVSFDKIKKFISDYAPEKYRGVVSELAFDLAQSAIQKGFSLLVEGNVKIQKESRAKYSTLAQKNSIKFFEVNLEAPLEVLKTRFAKRVEEAARTWTTIYAKTEADMMDRYTAYCEYKNSALPTFDSSALNPEQIVVEIEKMFGTRL